MLAHCQHLHVDERCVGGVDDDVHECHPSLGGLGAIGLDTAGLFVGSALRRFGRYFGQAALFNLYTNLGRCGGFEPECAGFLGAFVSIEFAHLDVFQWHWTGDEVASFFLSRARIAAEVPTAFGSGPERRVHEHIAHCGTFGGRDFDSVRRECLCLFAQRGAVRGGSDFDVTLEASARAQPLGG